MALSPRRRAALAAVPLVALSLGGCTALVEHPEHPTPRQVKARRQRIAGDVLLWTGATAAFVGAMETTANANDRQVALGAYRTAVLDLVPGTGGPCDPQTHPENLAACTAHRDAARKTWQDAKDRAYVGPVVLGTGLAGALAGAILFWSANGDPPASPGSASVRPSAWLLPGAAGLGLGGTFR